MFSEHFKNLTNINHILTDTESQFNIQNVGYIS